MAKKTTCDNARRLRHAAELVDQAADEAEEAGVFRNSIHTYALCRQLRKAASQLRKVAQLAGQLLIGE